MHKRYEYRVVSGAGLMSSRQMEEFGKDGWELVTIVYDGDEGLYFFYFKREVKSVNS